MGNRLAVGAGVAAGVALLVAGAASAGLLGLRGGDSGATVITTSAPVPHAAPTVGTRTAGPVPTLDPDRVLAGVALDPAVLPVRGVDNAAVIVLVQDDAVALHEIALDATTGEWVRLDPATAVAGSLLDVSPDGRSASRPAVDLSGGVIDGIVDLATGASHPSPEIVPPGQDPDYCHTWPVTWAPSGARVATVTWCVQRPPLDPAQPREQGVWLHEVDIASGAARLVEELPGASTHTPQAHYSPDGRLLAYVVEFPGEEGAVRMVLRIVALDGSGARTLEAVHPLGGDPWLDDGSLVAWDASVGVDVLVDAAAGTTTPLGLASFLEHAGTVGGRIVLTTRGGPMACGAAACVVDPETGGSEPWITLPGNGMVLTVLPARGVIQP